ncbi:MAG: helix-turn-helix transcriptional regulator [Bacteroidota bacterium]
MKTDKRLESFGLRLKELRLKSEYSQEELAEIAGLDRTYVSSCERGKRNISLLNILKFAEALNIEPASLLQKK